MTNSQNGWSIRPAKMTHLRVAGVDIGPVRSGPVFVIAQYVCTRYNDQVQPLRAGQCGAYNPRKIAGTDVWSNHASATAWDLNWLLHQEGSHGTFTYQEHQQIIAMLNHLDGVVRWGEEFGDPMHFEIHGNNAAVTAVANRLEKEAEDMPTYTLDEIASAVVGKLESKVLGASGPNWSQDVERTESIENKVVDLAAAVTAIKADVADILAAVTADPAHTEN